MLEKSGYEIISAALRGAGIRDAELDSPLLSVSALAGALKRDTLTALHLVCSNNATNE